MESIKAVIFDLDGTLIESAPHIHHVSNQLLCEMGRAELPFETVSGFIGNGVAKLIERITRATGELIGVSAQEMPQLMARFTELYVEEPEKYTDVFEHVPETLKALQEAGIKIGVCTNKLEGLSQLLLAKLGFGQYVDALVGGDTLPVMKPDPAPVLETMRRIGGEKTNTIYIGDSETDAQAAKNAGLRFGFYEGGYCHCDPNTLNPSFRFGDYKTLGGIIAAI